MDAQNAQSQSASLRDVVVGAVGNVQPSVDRTSSMPNVVNGEDRGGKPKARSPRKAAAPRPKGEGKGGGAKDKGTEDDDDGTHRCGNCDAPGAKSKCTRTRCCFECCCDRECQKVSAEDL